MAPFRSVEVKSRGDGGGDEKEMIEGPMETEGMAILPKDVRGWLDTSNRSGTGTVKFKHREQGSLDDWGGIKARVKREEDATDAAAVVERGKEAET